MPVFRLSIDAFSNAASIAPKVFCISCFMADRHLYLSPEKITLQLVGQERFLHSHLFFHRIFQKRPRRICIVCSCPAGKAYIQQFSHKFKFLISKHP